MSEQSEALNKAYAAYDQDQTDIEAFARLKAELLNLVKGAIYKVFGEAEDPHALAQDIGGDILLALPTYRGEKQATFSTWAYSIAKRKAIDKLREMNGGRRNRGRPESVAKKPVDSPSLEQLADLYAHVNTVAVTEKERLFVRRILGKGLPHPLSAADRQRLSRLCKKLGLRDVTRIATNRVKGKKDEEIS
jgi:DNA-directed RNA polymerase specialized sigma24 family protein